ncbi:MAG: 3-deoxy-manno-octulosonate cytidylyltransferase [Bacteroidales bacterium]|jgi:3-deoxy-manno-octulosonate cytidylyltransferase (CMP-KDO synthetase)|nr:3-deoxy-manno-octulosonate cytidylyltransferase [Bacteroidales bacterium]
MKKNIIGIIPAKMSSKNFPNKPMADILGMPMIGHVYNRVKLCSDFTDVFVATADPEIIDYIKSIGGNYIKIEESRISATDRVAEAVKLVENQYQVSYDLVVLIQPDEPMVTPDMIGRAISPLVMDKSLKMTTLMAEITSDEIFNDRNEIKVVADTQNNAMYLSREPIPTSSKNVTFPRMKLVGIDVFRRDFLNQFNMMIPTPLEVAESIDLIRIIENGMKIKMTLTDVVTYAVNHPEELDKVRELMKKEEYILKQYMQ